MVSTISSATGNIEFADSGAGAPVLYFHGILSGSQLALRMEQSLVADGFRLIVPHRPGYFGTPLGARTSAADCADLAALVLDHLGIDRAAVMGTSAGGPPAMAFAMRHPNRTSALVLQCAQVHRWDSPQWLPSKHHWTFRWLKHAWTRCWICFGYRLLLRSMAPAPRKCLQEWAGDRFPDIENDPAALDIAESFLASIAGGPGYDNDMTICVRENVLEQGHILCPTLLLNDELDPTVPICHAEFAAQQIADAQLVKLQVGGHLIWVGRDAEQMRTVRSGFLKQHLLAVS